MILFLFDEGILRLKRSLSYAQNLGHVHTNLVDLPIILMKQIQR